ncbi:putative Late nodulin [Medicago truncatula]|uniref:Nodule Cysteine-Rich (NCR) secreted peptide n=1 Tax=Medicago truncatula TaxID=3880 RepID=G7JHR4_MEDTR|nr:Nodule Cysteine-Rich (NCR) secreted peptide [Medicago truncatula]RHN63221.1 putative Late nodulin [Medicago truncatula]
MAGNLKIVYALMILVSLILVVTSHSFLPCVTKDDCAYDECISPRKPTCYLETCHCL